MIPRQDLETGEARAHEKLIENTAFNSWNVSSNAFEPVGSMNRARQRVYEASAAIDKIGRAISEFFQLKSATSSKPNP